MNSVSVCCVYHTGDNIGADSNKVTLRPCDDKPMPYFCTLCGKRFTTKHTLTVHLRLHSGEDVFACTQCKKQFTAYVPLKLHMNIHIGKYRCTECGKCCHSNYELTVHRRSHSGEKPFECSVCSKRFARSGHLVRHSRITQERNHSCVMCVTRRLVVVMV